MMQKRESMKDTLQRVAALAKLEVPKGHEEVQLEADLWEILHFVDKMKDFPVTAESGGKDMAAGEHEPVREDIMADRAVFGREDIVTNGDQKEHMMAGAPRACEQGFVVPRSF